MRRNGSRREELPSDQFSVSSAGVTDSRRADPSQHQGDLERPADEVGDHEVLAVADRAPVDGDDEVLGA
jgi:hypothetical protein